MTPDILRFLLEKFLKQTAGAFSQLAVPCLSLLKNFKNWDSGLHSNSSSNNNNSS